MKKTLTLLLAGVLAAGMCAAFAACDNDDEGWVGETVTITCLNASAEEYTKEVPYKPERVAILDYAVLDMMDVFGVGDKVVSSAEGTISYLSSYWAKMGTGEIASLGNLKEPDMEAVQQSEPDIIFIGGRQSSYYAQFEEIAPVVYLTVSAGTLVEDTLANARTVAKIFGIEDSVVNAKLNDVSSRIDALKAIARPEGETAKTCMVLMYNTETSISALASDGRCSLISNEIGFNLVQPESVESDSSGSYHGSSISFESIASINPDYIFVLNRGYVTSGGENTNDMVKSVIMNKVTEGTKAAQDGHIIVMENPDVWYTAEGGINALLTMIQDLESELLG